MSEQILNAPVSEAAPVSAGSRRGPHEAGRAEAAVTERAPGFWTFVKEDYIVNGRDWTRPGFRAMLMYRFGVWRMGKSKIIRMPLSVLYRWMHRFVRNRYGIEIHYTTKIGRRCRIGHQHGIVIHEHATIGDDCTIRQGVTIGAAAEYSVTDAPVLGNHVDIGAGAMILGRIKIGDHVRIGPNAVIMMNVPANSTAFAQPARIITPPAPTKNHRGTETQRSD